MINVHITWCLDVMMLLCIYMKSRLGGENSQFHFNTLQMHSEIILLMKNVFHKQFLSWVSGIPTEKPANWPESFATTKSNFMLKNILRFKNDVIMY